MKDRVEALKKSHAAPTNQTGAPAPAIREEKLTFVCGGSFGAETELVVSQKTIKHTAAAAAAMKRGLRQPNTCPTVPMVVRERIVAIGKAVFQMPMASPNSLPRNR